ncbi:hypothetical protein GCM10010502_73650 [Kitasatospora aureofaciens]|uniref:Uncharacterized protein n=1 Tax=Kitasatospora aureofaciens TaxID=1894 RepID=A0A8H9LRU5_KITAU|nr:hypothetical protein GCM10010502_73650 [Kitasatospora aureofaciens]
MAGVGVPVGAAFLELGLFQGLLDVLQGHSGGPAADPAEEVAEQSVLLAVGLVLLLGQVSGGWVLGEGGVQRRAGLPRLGVHHRLRRAARADAVDDRALRQGHPAVQAVDVALRPTPGQARAVVEGTDAVVAAPAQPHRPAHQRGVEDRAAQVPVGGPGPAAARGQLQLGRGGGVWIGAGGVGRRVAYTAGAGLDGVPTVGSGARAGPGGCP